MARRQTADVFLGQTLANLLDRMGVQVNPTAILVRNTAAVMLTANFTPLRAAGKLESMCRSPPSGTRPIFRGGLLVLTPLKAATGTEVFAVAQGSVVTGGFALCGRPRRQFDYDKPSNRGTYPSRCDCRENATIHRSGGPSQASTSSGGFHKRRTFGGCCELAIRRTSCAM